MHTAFINTSSILTSMAVIEERIKRTLGHMSKALESNPTTLEKIMTPNISPETKHNRDLWNERQNHISQCQKELLGFRDQLSKKLQMSYGEKGVWFGDSFEQLKSMCAYNLSEYQKFSDWNEKLLLAPSDAENLDPINVKKFNLHKKHLDEDQVRYKKSLDQLQQKVDDFKLISDNLVKLMETTEKKFGHSH